MQVRESGDLFKKKHNYILVSARISDLDKQKDGHGAAYFDQLKTVWD